MCKVLGVYKETVLDHILSQLSVFYYEIYCDMHYF